jgi:F-type H+-transporting ATPase subunit epsilon
MSMHVRLVVPSGVLLEQQAVKVVAEAQDGVFCLLPRHIDFVAALVPGILGLTAADGEETFVAVDDGILVKHGPQVLVSTWNALRGKLGELQEGLVGQLRERGEQDQKARLALDRLEASLVHQVREWER